MKISFHNKSYTSKPSKAQTIEINNVIAKTPLTITKNNLATVVKKIGAEGYTFCPATFTDGRRRVISFEQMQLFVLDFDNDKPDKIVSYDAAMRRAELYDLPTVFAYDTLSSQDHNKFRVVFLNDAPITDPRVAKAMLNALTTIYPEADPNSKDISRMFFGGKGLLHYDDTIPRINVELVLRNLMIYLEHTYDSNNYRREIKKFAKATGIALNGKGLLDVTVTEGNAETQGASAFEKNLQNPSMVYYQGKYFSRSYVVNFDEHCTGNLSDKTTSTPRSYPPKLLVEVRKRCQLYREFEDNSRRLSHDELFGLVTNLSRINSGSKHFKGLLRSNHYYDDRPEKYRKWEQDIRYIRAIQSCAGYCPYHDQCSHGTNILSAVRVGYHQHERLTNYSEQFVSLEEAEDDFGRTFREVFNACGAGVYVIKAQTAIGKTAIYLDTVGESTKNSLIAVPTNVLKREVQERGEAQGIELTVSPSLREMSLPDSVRDDLDSLYNSGKSVIPYIKRAIKYDDPDCAPQFRKYMSKLEKFNNADGNVVTTHRRLVTMDVAKYDNIIIDEDIILSTIIPDRTTVTVSDLRKILKEIPTSSPLAIKLRKLLKHIKNKKFLKLKSVPYKRKLHEDISVEVDIPALCTATHFCFRGAGDNGNELGKDCVCFMNPVKFDLSKKYIVLSATADEEIYQLYFGADDVHFYECARTKNKGELIQYGNRSMSRADIDNDPTVLKRISTWTGFKHTITFKKYKRHKLYFGNSAGCDELKGENIDVIGTPHQPEWIYKLFAFSILPDFSDEDITPNVLVEHNGWRFRFTTYRDEDLKAIQFYLIESELEQAVGRARLLRCDCKVNLFSNFPLRQADIREAGYEKQAEE